MNEIQIFLTFLTGFITTFIYTPKFIKKATEKGFLARDMYKKGTTIPTMGGLSIFAGIMASLIVAYLLHASKELTIFYFIITLFALFGLADDLLGIRHRLKILMPFILALPIAATNPGTEINLFFTSINLGQFYLFILAPMYVMVTANLVNMHSGYNGLSCGLSYILLSFLVIRVFIETGFDNLMYIMPIFGALLAFLYFNTYPAKIFWGNIGSMMTGAAIGCFIIVTKLELFGIVIMLPHIINFFMYVIWKIKKLGDVKFGELRDDGTLKVPNPWTLKWTFPYYVRLTEHQSMWIMYTLTTISGIIGLLFIPYPA